MAISTRKRMMGRIVMGMVLALVANACSPPPAPSTTAPSTTAPPPDVTTTTVGPVTSEQVAAAFFEAWKAGDREVMEHLSEPTALAEADGLSELTTESWEPELCEGAAGTVYCSWVSDAGTLAIGVRNIEEPHIVTSVMMMNP